MTSSLTLTDEALDRQQEVKQRQTLQNQNPYYQQDASGYVAPEGMYDQNQAYSDHSQTYHDPHQPNQQYAADPSQGYYDPNYDPNQQQADPNQGYYDLNYDPNQQQADPNQGYYDPNYDPNQQYADPNQGYYDPNYDPNQQYADPNQGYYDPNYDPNQQYVDPNQGYYDPNDDPNQQYSDPNQGYYDPNYDPNQQYADPNQGYYDPNYDPNQQYADPNQGYYDPNYDPNQQYADPNQGYYDPNYGSNQPYGDPQSEYNPYGAPPPTTRPKRKPKTAEDYYRQMLGEGQLFATDSDESPYEESGQTFRPVHPGSNTPEHLIPRNSLLDLLGPIAKYIRLILAKYKFLSQKLTYYTDMVIEIQEHVQKELKEAFGQAFKGLLDQLRQKSPVSLPYQQGQQPLPPGSAPHPGQPPPPPQNYTPVSFVDLHELNVDFTDNYDQPLFDFSRYANSRYTVSKMIVDPQAMEMALYAIRECAPRASAIPPATEGPYANLPLSEVMMVIGETDLQAFLRYVKAYPGNYVARSLKISETFATWVVYGAPQP
ncbi:MAG: hypothetical protein AB7I41_13540 [Candidatus Sericytochromatia bacterium]